LRFCEFKGNAVVNTASTRPQFLAALQVLDEGRVIHSPQELEDAKALLRPIARYQWSQGLLLAACFIALAALARTFQLNWPWSADLIVSAFAAAGISQGVMRISAIRSYFAPVGFELDDVVKAARYVFA
jgi:hypothetical protein